MMILTKKKMSQQIRNLFQRKKEVDLLKKAVSGTNNQRTWSDGDFIDKTEARKKYEEFDVNTINKPDWYYTYGSFLEKRDFFVSPLLAMEFLNEMFPLSAFQ